MYQQNFDSFSLLDMPKQDTTQLIIYDWEPERHEVHGFDQVCDVPYALRSSFLDLIHATHAIPHFVVWIRSAHPVLADTWEDMLSAHYGTHGLVTIPPAEILRRMRRGSIEFRTPTISDACAFIRVEAREQLKREMIDAVRNL